MAQHDGLVEAEVIIETQKLLAGKAGMTLLDEMVEHPFRPALSVPEPEPGIITCEIDPDVLEYVCCEDLDRPELPWES